MTLDIIEEDSIVKTTKNYSLNVKGSFQNEVIDEQIDIVEEGNKLKIWNKLKNSD